MDWIDDIKTGAPIVEAVAKADVNLDRALLSPKILKAVSSGTLAPNASSKALTRIQIAVDWTDQEALILAQARP